MGGIIGAVKGFIKYAQNHGVNQRLRLIHQHYVALPLFKSSVYSFVFICGLISIRWWNY